MTFLDSEFEFDPVKDALNRKKHGIDFYTAALVFSDPLRIECVDDSVGNTNEERWQTLGKVGKVIFVVYTERGKRKRIISARIATKAEKRSYYGYDNNYDKGWTAAN